MTVSISVDGVTFEFPNERAVRTFAECRKGISGILGEAAKGGPSVHEAVLRTPIQESAKPKAPKAEAKPLHEMSGDEVKSLVAAQIWEQISGPAKPAKKVRESKKRVKESKKQAQAPAEAPENPGALFDAMTALHGQQWGRGIGGTYTLSQFIGSENPGVIRTPGITPDGRV